MIEPIQRILVRGTNWVGDAVITLPALRELRRIFPQAKISLLVKPWVAGIFEDVEAIDEVIPYDRKGKGLWRTIKELRSHHFDLVVLFQNAFEAAVIAWGSGASCRMGFPTEGRGFLLSHPLALTKEIQGLHQIYYYLHIVAQVETRLTRENYVDFSHLNYQLPVRAARQQAIRTKATELGIDLTKKIVALNPGATNSRAKRWPSESFAGLADLLTRQGCEVVFIGAATELDITQTVVSKMQTPAKILTGKTSLAESIAFLSICDLLISNDTGPAYLSAALDRPTLTIFGPTNDQMIRPFGSKAEMLRHPVECAPCMLRDCPIDHRCMTGITIDKVFAQALAILAR